MDKTEIDEGWDAPSGGTAEPSREDSTKVADGLAARTDQWCVNIADGDIVHMSTSDMMDALRAGRVSERTLVWREGMTEWLAMSSVPSLRLAASKPPPAPARPATLKPVPRPSLAPKPGTEPPPRATLSGRPSSRPSSPRSGSLSAVAFGSRAASSPRSAQSTPHAAPPPSAPANSAYDDDDDERTQVMTGRNLQLMQELASAASAQALEPSAAPSPQPSPPIEAAPVLAVYERPMATLAFADADSPSSEPAPVVAVQELAPRERPVSAATATATPSVVVRATPRPEPTSGRGAPLLPDSFSAIAATAREETQVRAAVRRSRSRMTLVASIASALVASAATAVLVRSPDPAPLVVAPRAPTVATTAAAAAALPMLVETAAPSVQPPVEPAASVAAVAASAAPASKKTRRRSSRPKTTAAALTQPAGEAIVLEEEAAPPDNDSPSPAEARGAGSSVTEPNSATESPPSATPGF